MAAKPPLVVAKARKPNAANNLADPGSQGFGSSTGSPGTCKERNSLGLGHVSTHAPNLAEVY